MSMKHAPIQRDESLQPFSRDHYVGLVRAQHLIKATRSDAAARRGALAEFLDAWDSEIADHFNEEQRLLAGLMTAEQADRLHGEHQHLRALAEEARQRRRQVDPGSDWVEHLGQTLNDHIRWEERELFDAIQKAAESQALADLKVETDKLEARRARSQSGGDTTT